MKIIEEFTCSKSGNPEENEDLVFHNDDFVLLVDGTTSKNKEKIGNKTSGRVAAEIILEAVKSIDLWLSPFDMLQYISRYLKEKSKGYGFLKSPSATFLLYNRARAEIIRYGDSGFMINGNLFVTVKEIDLILSSQRSEFLKQELEHGKTVEELRRFDTGRQAILPSLSEMDQYANREGEFGYPVINGDDIFKKYIEIYSVANADEIVFASDGYPTLKGTLIESEELLKQILENDPLCINLFKSTKGVLEGQKSFDDRSYIRFSV